MKNAILVLFFGGFACVSFSVAGQSAARLSTTNIARLATMKVNPATARTLPSVTKTNLISPALKLTDATRLKAFVRDGAAWTIVEPTAGSDGNTIKPSVPKNATVIVTSPVTNRILLKQDTAPMRFALATPQSSSHSSYETFDLDSYTVPNPVRWDAAKGAFEAELRVALLRTNRTSRQPPLIPVTFDFVGRNADITPSQLTFTNVGSYQSLRVTFLRNDVEARIDVHPLTEEAPLVIPARWVRNIAVSVSPSSILGLGLGTATVTVKRLDQDGKDLSEGPDLPLIVTQPFADTQSNLGIAAGSNCVQFQVRSAGTERRKIMVSAGDLSDDEFVELRPIWPFLAAVLAGGMAGGCVRILKAKKSKPKIVKFLLEACVAGLLATAAVSAGVAFSVIPAAVANSELGVFLTSAAVGMVGIAAIRGLKNLIPQFPK